MEELDWSEFKRRIPIRASKELIIDHWSTQENLEKWFLSSAQFYSPDGQSKGRVNRIEAGDSYKWMWHGSDHVAEGEVFEISYAHIKFSFLGCVVNTEVVEEQGQRILELVQSEIPTDESTRMSHYVGCTRGWTFFMTNLKSILEGGIDLRNKDIKLKDVINT